MLKEKVVIEIDPVKLITTLKDNIAVRDLIERLPCEIRFENLHGRSFAISLKKHC